jgi:NTP pyrophosphatase (non-canonical NTP hydrolase)
MKLSEFQRLIEKIYFDKDSARGLEGTFFWFVEEVGELAAALREDSDAAKSEEFADCLAWLSTLARVLTWKRPPRNTPPDAPAAAARPAAVRGTNLRV